MSQYDLGAFDQVVGHFEVWIVTFAMEFAEAFRIHHAFVTTIARTASSTPEHVVIMARVIAVLKAIGAY